MPEIYDANRYIARMLGDEAALEEVEDGRGVALNQPSGIFWEHAWEMLDAFRPVLRVGASMRTTEMNARKRDYRANKYVARMLGDAAALKDDKGVSGATGVFWAHAWDMLNARMSYSGNTKMWQAYMCEVDPAKTQELNALSSRKLDALIKVGICLEPSFDVLLILAVRLNRPDLLEPL